jgi:Fibronectin type III domain
MKHNRSHGKLTLTWFVSAIDDGAKPPANLSVLALSSSSMLVSWKDSPLNAGLIVVAYNVEYFITELGARRSLGKVAQLGTYKMVIDELQADTNYSVYMVTFATSGRSKPSDIITVVTGVDSEFVLLVVLMDFTFLFLL